MSDRPECGSARQHETIRPFICKKRIYKPIDTLDGSLKYRFLLGLVALNTKPMRWFGFAFIWLQRVDEHAGVHRLKAVLRRLSLPLLLVHQLFFEIVFFIQNRLMLSLQVKDCRLEFDDREV